MSPAQSVMKQVVHKTPPISIQNELWQRMEAAQNQLTSRREASKSLRILHVIMSLAPADGGPPEMLRQLAGNYRAMGDSLEVVTLDDPTAPYLQDCPFRVHPLGPKQSKYGLSRRLLSWLFTHAGRFNLILINNVWLFPAVAAWLAASKARIPYAVFTHGALDVYFKKRYPLKHLKKCLYCPLQYLILRNASAVLFTSELERELALTSFRPNRWASVVVPYGTNQPTGDPDAQRLAFYNVAPKLRNRRFFLFLSRIHEKKGCDLLLNAFAQVASEYPEVDLVIAGPDQMRLQAKLQAQAKRAGIAHRVLWPGMLRDALKYGALRAAEAFVLPSHQENFGIVVAEALACGTPVLISNQVNIWREIISSGVGLVETDTLEGTVKLLRRWLSMSEAQHQAITDRTEAAFGKHFSLRRLAEAVHTLAEIFEEQRNAAKRTT